jgi:hypothetical protein
MAEQAEKSHSSGSGTAALEHMEEEFRALEQQRRPWGLWIGGLVLIVVAGAAYFGLADRTKGKSAPGLAATGGAVIELSEPRGGRLALAPTHFAWESISGRYDYRFVLSAEGESAPLVDRAVKQTSLDLKPEELTLLTAGRSYSWVVTARQQDRRVLATGQGRFQLR